VVVSKVPVKAVIEAATGALYTATLVMVKYSFMT
jgi:hypothetical protein